MDINKAKLSHKNKVSEGILKFSPIRVAGYGHDDAGFVHEVVNKTAVNKTYQEKYIEDYDTYIWTKEILEPSEIKLWMDSIKKEMENGKNIYNMARLYRISDCKYLKEYAENNNVEYFDCSNPYRFEELREYAENGLNGIDSTVITIMGTGRQSGKFTTSMILKKNLEKYFKIGTVGTEPQSKICGNDEMVIPQPIPSCHVASTILGAVKKVDMNDKDVIIVSGQTGIFSNPLEVGTGRGGGIISLSILFGSKPDYVILASNTADINQIKKNIKAIEFLSESKVVGITLNNKNLNLNEEKLKKLSINIFSELNIPVANVVGGVNLNMFVNNIIELLKK